MVTVLVLKHFYGCSKSGFKLKILIIVCCGGHKISKFDNSDVTDHLMTINGVTRLLLTNIWITTVTTLWIGWKKAKEKGCSGHPSTDLKGLKRIRSDDRS